LFPARGFRHLCVPSPPLPHAPRPLQNWHFIDLPVIGNPWHGTLPPLPYTDSNPWAITGAQSTVYSTKSTKLDKSRQLRFIIHLVGDAHQPLHAAALFSDQFPTGDMGGNLFPIVLPGTNQWTNELHAVWDGGAGLWTEDIVRPLNSTGLSWLYDFADKIIAAYPKDDPSIAPLIKEYNASTWANESHDIASTFAYTAPQAPTVIPQDYLDTAQTTCQRQIAIGGYRLADLLEYIFTATEWGREAVEELRAEGKLDRPARTPENPTGGFRPGSRAPSAPSTADGPAWTHAELERPSLRAKRALRA
jgi:hypothetical protein